MGEKNHLTKAAKLVYWAAIIALIVIAVLTMLSLLGIPKQFRVFVVESGSMSPAIPTGSVIFISPTGDYKVNDVVTYTVDPNRDNPNAYIVTHRIVDKIEDNGVTKFQTKGDANENADALLLDQSNIIGEAIFNLPLIGHVVGFAKTKIGFVVLIIIPTIVIIYSEIINIQKEFKILAFRKKLRIKKL